MKNIVISGQMDKEKIANIVKKLSQNRAKITIKGDIEASMDMKNDLFDYYIGACNTGQGGAIAMPIAIVGLNYCATISSPGKISSKEEIESFLNDGKTIFGFTAQHAEEVLPILIPLLLEK